MSLSAATLTLNGSATDVWIFQAGTTLTTATSTSIILEGRAREENIFWALGTSATIGYASAFKGNILASAAISFGHDSSLVGRALAMTAVTFEGGSSVSLPGTTTARKNLRTAVRPVHATPDTTVDATPETAVEAAVEATVDTTVDATVDATPYTTPDTTPDTTVILGACAKFALDAGSAMTFDGTTTTVSVGDIGVSPGTTLTGSLIHNGLIDIVATNSNQCASDRITAYNQLAAMVCSTLRFELGGITVTPGVYCSTGAMSLTAGILYFDGKGLYVFQAASTIITSGSTKMVLSNYAQASDIYWKVGSSATIGHDSVFCGTIIAYASITYNINTTINGRGLAGAGISFAGNSMVTLY